MVFDTKTQWKNILKTVLNLKCFFDDFGNVSVSFPYQCVSWKSWFRIVFYSVSWMLAFCSKRAFALILLVSCSWFFMQKIILKTFKKALETLHFFRSILGRSWGWFWPSLGEAFGRQNREKTRKINPKTEKMRSKNGAWKRDAKKHQKSLQHKPVIAGNGKRVEFQGANKKS